MSGETNAEEAVYGSISDSPPRSIRSDVEVAGGTFQLTPIRWKGNGSGCRMAFVALIT
jgi:hypothetical protein